MSILGRSNTLLSTNDYSLVMNSLGGDRNAFCQIVSRYQTLLCSLAYSSVGDIKHSEDIAQEVFVEAWKKLGTLHEPEKLKAWLCGILRFKVSHFLRKENNKAARELNKLDEIAEHQIAESKGSEIEQTAIQDQQDKLLWKVLDEIDAIYREPLILFYREQQSIEYVASELNLSKETVKQRLSRGRKLLKRNMTKLVEIGLKNSKPGTTFTAAVMTAISGISPPAKAAAIGASVVKTNSIFKFASVLSFIAIFSGLISAFFGLRSTLDQSRTQRERHLAIKVLALFMLFAGIYVAGMFILKYLALNYQDVVGIYTVMSQLLVLTFIASYFILIKKMFIAVRNLRAQERIFEPQAFLREVDQKNSAQQEYKSKLTFLGVPLIHIQFGMSEINDKPAYGWIAGGSYARGLIFAWGGVAIAPFSVGILAIGIINIGAIGIGIFSTGTVAIGLIAFGASAIAYKAYASLSALGINSSFSNGFSIASDAAIGPISYATHINNEKAAEIINLTFFIQNYQWALAFIAAFVLIPSIWHSIKVKQRMR